MPFLYFSFCLSLSQTHKDWERYKYTHPIEKQNPLIVLDQQRPVFSKLKPRSIDHPPHLFCDGIRLVERGTKRQRGPMDGVSGQGPGDPDSNPRSATETRRWGVKGLQTTSSAPISARVCRNVVLNCFVSTGWCRASKKIIISFCSLGKGFHLPLLVTGKESRNSREWAPWL